MMKGTCAVSNITITGNDILASNTLDNKTETYGSGVHIKGNGGNVAGTGLIVGHTASSVGIVWGSPAVDAVPVKTVFDPCPAGWKVPAYKGGYSPLSRLGSAGTDVSSVGTYSNYGVTWTAVNSGFWPMSGYWASVDGLLYAVGVNGYYWFATAPSEDSNSCYCMYFSDTSVYPSSSFNMRAGGANIRCVRK